MAVVQAIDHMHRQFSRGIFAILITLGAGPVAVEPITVKNNRTSR